MNGPLASARSARSRVEAVAGLADLDRLVPRLDAAAAAVAETTLLAEGLERRVAELEQLLVPLLTTRVADDGDD